MIMQKFEIDTIDKDGNVTKTVLNYNSSTYNYNQYYKRVVFLNYLVGGTIPENTVGKTQYEVFVRNYFKSELKIKEIRIYVNNLLVSKYDNCIDVDYSVSIAEANNPSDPTSTGTTNSIENLKIILS